MKLCAHYIRYQLKLIPAANILVCILVVSLAPFIFSFKMLSFKEAADIGELFISLTGIILLPSISSCEKDGGTVQVVYSKKESAVFAQAVRLLAALSILMVCCASFGLLTYAKGGMFNIWEVTAGVFITAAATGLSGYTAGVLLKKIQLAYLLPFMWYCFEFFTSGKYTGELYLFSLRKGCFTDGKLILGLIAAALVLLGLSCIKLRRNYPAQYGE